MLLYKNNITIITFQTATIFAPIESVNSISGIYQHDFEVQHK